MTTSNAFRIPAVLALLFASAAQAAVFNVTSSADAGAGSLRDALAQANASPGPDQITFDAGLGDIVLSSPLVSTETVQIVGPVAGQTISGNDVTRIFSVPVPGASIVLQDLLLTNGRTTIPGDPMNPCSDTDGRGGAVCTVGAAFISRVTVRNSGTTGDGADGGGLYLGGGGDLGNSIIRDNFAQGDEADGGGVYAETIFALINSLVQGNEVNAPNARGGGVLVPSGADFGMTNSAVIANFSEGSAGGLRVGRTFIENSTVANNTATINGGMAVDVSINLGGDPGTPIIRNSTIVDNLDLDPVSTAGGGLRVLFFQTDYTLTLESVLLAGNFGPSGNFNVVGVAADPGLNTASVTIDASYTQFGDPAGEINGLNENNVFDNDSALLPLGDRGCAVMAGAPGTQLCVPVHEVQLSSPALNAGSNPSGLQWDQRGDGFPRVLGGQADIGAFESALAGIPPNATPIPTLDFRALLLLALLAGGFGAARLRMR